MPKSVAASLEEAKAALAALGAAVTPLAKAAFAEVVEAAEAHAEAVRYDNEAGDFLTKADKADKDAAEHKKAGKEDLAKAATTEAEGFRAQASAAGEMAVVSHDLVKAYFETCEDTLEKAENSPWFALAADVKAYHEALQKGELGNAEEIDKLAKKAREDKDEPTAVALETLAKSARERATIAETLAKAAVYPPAEIVLDKPMTMPDGSFSVLNKAELLANIGSYGKLPDQVKGPVQAHLMNCAKALNTKLPASFDFHKPDNLTWNRQPTAKFNELSAADKVAAMSGRQGILNKGILIVGPAGQLLAGIGAFAASDAVAILEKADGAHANALADWLVKGNEILSAAIATGVEGIAEDFDLQTAPPLAKASGWASAAAKALMSSLTEEATPERKAQLTKVAERLDAAHNFFLAKADDLGEGGDEALRKSVTEAQQALEAERRVHIEELAKAAGERDAATIRLTEFTTQIAPLVKSAQDMREQLRKSDDTNQDLKLRVAKLEATPMPMKGYHGAAQLLSKSDDVGPGRQADRTTALSRVNAMPPGPERSAALIAAAHNLRGAEKRPGR